MSSFARGRQPPEVLHLSQDRKVSPRGTYQGPWRTRPERWIPTVPNSFGLPAGTSCPGRTTFCHACYAVRAERSQGVAALVEHNYRLLTQAAATAGITGMAVLLCEMVGRYETEADRVGLDPAERIFRIHWDGDFFSADYARAWADTIAEHPAVRFWAYTRSFRPPVDVVPILAGTANLALYLSVDGDNAADAVPVLAAYPRVRAAYSTADYDAGRDLSELARPDGSGPGRLVCPENAGRVPLMQAGVGACVTCGVCVRGSRDVLFSTSHRDSLAAPVRLVTKPRGDYVCELAECGATFARPLSSRGPKPRFCSREHQCRARYLASRR